MDKKTVLVVEDHADTRELLRLCIRHAGYEVVEAATGVEAMDRVRYRHPDLIVMDLGLPELSGDQVIEQLRADPATQDIPVVVNSAYPPDSTLVRRATAAGVSDVLRKPITFNTLRQTVDRFLGAS